MCLPIPRPGRGRALTRLAAACLIALWAAACATPRAPGPPSQGARPETFADLPGWRSEDHAAAFNAFRATCRASRDAAMTALCGRAMAVDLLDGPAARAFFERHFRPEILPGEGVLTAYFAPEYPGRSVPDAEFSAPLRPRPADLVLGGASGREPLRRASDGTLGPYPDRAWIETEGPRDALAYMRPEDLFFLQIQGSGTLIFPDGTRRKALFAATNGQPFVGVANRMRDLGLLPADKTSGEAIRAWLAAHRGPDAEAVMRMNPRYAFFSLVPDDGLPPVGASNIPLPAGRAIAIDPAWNRLGDLFWIDGQAPLLSGAYPVYQRLVTALDTGGAIKGQVRADLYLGEGDRAGLEAGRVRHRLHLHRLVPRDAR